MVRGRVSGGSGEARCLTDDARLLSRGQRETRTPIFYFSCSHLFYRICYPASGELSPLIVQPAKPKVAYRPQGTECPNVTTAEPTLCLSTLTTPLLECILLRAADV